MKLTITAGEALDYGWWEKICDIKGYSVWAISEGQMDRNSEITLTQEEMQKFGILTF